MDLLDYFELPRAASFINGQFLEASFDMPLVSPITGKAWKYLANADANDIACAIQSAKAALPLWSERPAHLRGQLLRALGDILLAHKELFAKSMAFEMGKPLRDGAAEVEYAAGYFHWFSGEAERIYGKTIPSPYADKKLLTLFQPIGVCAAIVPWNFPIAMAARKIAAALAAGCTIVVKPAPECPITLLLLAVACRELQLPPGVLNILIGDGKMIGEALVASPLVKQLSFTGSSAVGRLLYAASAPTLKKLTLELGGSAPFIVCDDADLDKAVRGAIYAKFRNNGQSCVAAQRFLIQKNIFDPFVAKLVEAIQKLIFGNPLEFSTEISEIIHPSSLAKMQVHLQDALAKGAKLLYQRGDPPTPAILGGIRDDMAVWNEESFAPLIALTTFDTIEDAIALANASPYGLAAYAFTESLTRAYAFLEELECGMIGINSGRVSMPQAPFGGVKASGFGREGGYSGIDEYIVEKYACIQTN